MSYTCTQVHIHIDGCTSSQPRIDSVRLDSSSVNEKMLFFKILLIFYNENIDLSTN